MSSFRLDRSAFKAQTAVAASKHSVFYKNLSWQERLAIAAYLNSKAFNYPEDNPPKMDKNEVHGKIQELKMGNIFNEDFRDFIHALNVQNVRYLLVGGFSVILHGYARTTGDMDIWVERSKENYRKIEKAFVQFGMPVFDMTEQNFLSHPAWDVFTFGVPPVAIDVMTKLKGLEFNMCYDNSVIFQDGDLEIRTIHKNNLIDAKKASGRAKDLDDLENLQ